MYMCFCEDLIVKNHSHFLSLISPFLVIFSLLSSYLKGIYIDNKQVTDLGERPYESNSIITDVISVTFDKNANKCHL